MDQGSYTRKIRDVTRATGPRGPQANPYRDATGAFMASVAGGAAYVGCTNCFDVQAIIDSEKTVPGAPTGVSATAGNAQATISFTAPASDGGAPITSYTVTSSPGGITATGASSPITVTGLTNGTAYTFTVTATNSEGTSAASTPSAAVTPSTVPGAPTGVSAVKGNAQATVSFTAPVSDGGSAITSYTVTSSPGGFTATGASSPLTVTGLTNGTAYTFTVVATNSNGNSAASAPSAAVTPSTVPGSPTIVSAVAGNTQATISFAAPASNGGATITSYTVTSSPGGFTATGAGSPLTVTGLTNGVTYTFTAVATNINGNSAPSAASSPVIPSLSTPSAPTGLSIQSTTTSSITVSFTTPASDGGSAITNYKYSINGGATYTAFSPSTTSSPVTISGLSMNTTYPIRLRAVNSVGDGTESATLSATTATITGTPRVFMIGDGSVGSYAANLQTAKTTMGYGGTLTITTKVLDGTTGAYTGASDLTTANYDVVIMYTNGGIAYNSALGTNLNAYVASGGHLILNGFAWGNVPAITNLNYATNSTYVYNGTFTTTNVSTAYYPVSHPITNGISTTTGLTSQNIPNPISLTAGATAIAQYTNASGPYFIATKTVGSAKLIGINAYISGAIPTTNVIKMEVNAIYWCIGALV